MTADIIMQSSNMYSELQPPPVVGVSTEEEQRAWQIALQLSNLAMLGSYEDANMEDARGKKQNMTECVPVPSSEHVAEIVGKQGCKIKALRTKTNTYIKTPVRGEEPVFVVTGRKEDVALARREIQSAAEHFTQIRASRNQHALLASQALGTGNGEGCPGTITLQVRVPYRVVGLVVGPKGATIKRIQQQTHTYIVTPSRDKEPVFEVTGLPENVEKAKEEIEAHIAARTGTQQTSVDDDFKNNGTEVGSPAIDGRYMDSALVSSFQAVTSAPSAFLPYNVVSKSSLRSNAPDFFPSNATACASVNYNSFNQNKVLQQDPPGFGEQFQPSPADYSLASKAQWTGGLNGPDASNQFQSFLSCSSGFCESERLGSLSPTSSVGTHHPCLSPCFSDKEFPALPSASNSSMRGTMRRIASKESTASSVLSDMSTLFASVTASTPAVNIESGYSSGSGTASLASGSPSDPILGATLLDGGVPFKPKFCVVCSKAGVSAALVPCGHHLFCHGCADEIMKQPRSVCPCCHQSASMALPIKN